MVEHKSKSVSPCGHLIQPLTQMSKLNESNKYFLVLVALPPTDSQFILVMVTIVILFPVFFSLALSKLAFIWSFPQNVGLDRGMEACPEGYFILVASRQGVQFMDQ